MNALLAQLILARGNGVEGWMDILVLVVVAVVYGLGTIIKAKGKKKVQEQAEEQLTRRPGRKPAGSRGLLEQFFREAQRPAKPTPGREYRPAVQPARQKIARPQTAVLKYAAEAEQASRFQRKSPLPKTQVQPEFEKLPDFTRKAVEGLAGKRMDTEVPESEYLSEVLLDYAEPGELKKAILHYEILGRPLALRGPSDHIIGL